MAPPQARIDAYNAALKAAQDSGALDRISRLQFNIMTKHFPDGSGGVNFAGAQRTGAPGTREMNGLSDWNTWKNVAAAAIDGGVQKANWEKLLPSIETGLEIYRQVHPPRPVAAAGQLPIQTSVAARFGKDGTAPLAQADIDTLAKTINDLTTAQILNREAGKLKDDTSAALIGPPGDGVIAIAIASQTPVPGGIRVDLLLTVTDPLGMPVAGDTLDYVISEKGLELPPDTFMASGMPTRSAAANMRPACSPRPTSPVA